MSPAHPKRHANKNNMPAFRSDQGPGAEVYLQEFRAYLATEIQIQGVRQALFWMAVQYHLVAQRFRQPIPQAIA